MIGSIFTSVVNVASQHQGVTPSVITITPYFTLMNEIYGDAGALSQQWVNDKLVTGIDFHPMTSGAGLTVSDKTFISNNPTASLAYFAAPSLANVDPCYGPSTDDNAPTVLAPYTSRYEVWRNGANEFDQFGGCWPTGRPAFTGTDINNYNAFINFYLNTVGMGAAGLNQTAAARGYKWMGTAVFSNNAQFAYDLGVDMVLIERNIDSVDGMCPGLATVRGAATQNGGKDWGVEISNWNGWTNNVTLYSNGHLTSGWSTSTFNRNLMIAYMGGSNVIRIEAADFQAGAAPGQTYNPYGLLLQQFYNFAVTRHPNRGAPYVPIALMQDHYSGLIPKYGEQSVTFSQGNLKWYYDTPYTAGDTMLEALWRLVYPNYNLWGSLPAGSPKVLNGDGTVNINATHTAYINALAANQDSRPWEPMGSGKWGETFDVVTNKAGLASLITYKVVILATGVAMSDALLSTLSQYVTQGGTLVLNALQLSANAQALAGVTLGARSTATSEIWVPDGSTINENSYNYTIVTPTTATVIARTSGNPIVTKNNHGSGAVYVTTPDYMSDIGNNILLVGGKLIDLLQQQFAIATVSPTGVGLDYLINRDGNRTIVTLINTDLGGAAWNGTISFPPPPSPYSAQEWTADTQASLSVINGQVVVPASIPGYGVRVYALGTPH
jgi:hypothetical protein